MRNFSLGSTVGNPRLLYRKVYPPVLQIENTDSSTDVGSYSSSDGESGSAVVDSVGKVADSKPIWGSVGYRRRNSQQSSGHFAGTPLEPIPGTPSAVEEQTDPMLLLPTTAPAQQKPKHPLPSHLPDERGLATMITRVAADVPAIPPPRSPKRRMRQMGATRIASETVVNTIAIGSFRTSPTLPRHDSLETLRQTVTGAPRDSDSDSNVSCIRATMFGTRPALNAPPSFERTSKVTAKVTEIETGIRETPEILKTSKKEAREMLMVKAKRRGVPIKVQLRKHFAAVEIHDFDMRMPMKKDTVYADIAGPEPAAAILCIEASMPVKKSLSQFLMQEPFRTIQPTLGLECMARQADPYFVAVP